MKRVIGAHDWASAVNRGLVERLLGDSGTGVVSAARAGGP
jgi:hypothetical protein